MIIFRRWSNDFNGAFTSALDDEEEDIWFDNLCLINEFELLPGFRGKGLGASVIKDLYIRFGESVGQIYVNSTPFQNTMVEKMKSGRYCDDEFSKAMRYEDLEYDAESAQYKLNSFFQKMGFHYLTNNYFYLNTNYRQLELMRASW